MALLVWLNSAWNCWTVSCISLPQQAVCCYVKNTDDQLGNVNDIHKSDCAHCQWFHKSLLTFWNCYLALIIISFLNALFSLFLTGAYHYSHRYQSQCHRRLPNLNVPYFECHWMCDLAHQNYEGHKLLFMLSSLHFFYLLVIIIFIYFYSTFSTVKWNWRGQKSTASQNKVRFTLQCFVS